MFIQTESTPNPHTLKFLPGRDVLGDGAQGLDFADASATAIAPLAGALFAVDGVERVYLGSQFVAITKAADQDWSHVKPFVLAAMMDHFVAGKPVVMAGASEASAAAPIAYEGDAAEIVEQIKDLIETRVRPAVASDGGDIVFDSWDHENGVVRLHMRGACAGCPSSSMTLKQGIENMLKHYVPEVRAVEQAV